MHVQLLHVQGVWGLRKFGAAKVRVTILEKKIDQVKKTPVFCKSKRENEKTDLTNKPFLPDSRVLRQPFFSDQLKMSPWSILSSQIHEFKYFDAPFLVHQLNCKINKILEIPQNLDKFSIDCKPEASRQLWTCKWVLEVIPIFFRNPKILISAPESSWKENAWFWHILILKWWGVKKIRGSDKIINLP